MARVVMVEWGLYILSRYPRAPLYLKFRAKVKHSLAVLLSRSPSLPHNGYKHFEIPTENRGFDFLLQFKAWWYYDCNPCKIHNTSNYTSCWDIVVSVWVGGIDHCPEYDKIFLLDGCSKGEKIHMEVSVMDVSPLAWHIVVVEQPIHIVPYSMYYRLRRASYPEYPMLRYWGMAKCSKRTTIRIPIVNGEL